MAKFEVTAEPRSEQGTGASRRLRKAGKVPGILYGAGKPAAKILFNHNAIKRQLENEAFHSSILTVKLGADTDQAVLRDWQMHPWKPQVVHVDLQRVSATEKIHMRVPLHFLGADVAPGVKLQGGIVSHIFNEIDITCLPKDLPEFLTVDLSHLSIGDSVHLSDIKMSEGVAITSLAHGGDNLAVAAVMAIKEEVEEVPVAAVEAVPVEGAAAAVPGAPAAPGAAAPASGGEAKKGEASKVEAKKGDAPKAEGKKPEAGKKEGK
jgi:large subunit ribosomal protein L25